MILATNHAGWCVEILTEQGWELFIQADSRNEAEKRLRIATKNNFYPGIELRVYEILKQAK